MTIMIGISSGEYSAILTFQYCLDPPRKFLSLISVAHNARVQAQTRSGKAAERLSLCNALLDANSGTLRTQPATLTIKHDVKFTCYHGTNARHTFRLL